MHVARSLTLARASDIVDRALAIGREHGMDPLSVVVLDSAGIPVALKSEDGCGPMRIDVALAKAYGGLGMGASSRGMADKMRDRPTFSNALAAVTGGRYVPAPGGVLIVENGAAIGAVGISGDVSDKDEFCAILAIQGAGLVSDPAQPPEI